MKTSDKNRAQNDKLDKLVISARADFSSRENGYRQRALKMYPWVCGRCSREFDQSNLKELTVHHRDHDHDNNPEDGSNWELLCVFCHDNEHQRYIEQATTSKDDIGESATYNPFSDLKTLFKDTDPE
ncbi:MAG: YajD family HNH nuclease [Granulosicoccus sp.]